MPYCLLSAALLAGLPATAPKAQVSYGLRVVTVSAEADLPGIKPEEGGVAILTPDQLQALLARVQADASANVLMMPKVTAEDGQEATVQVERGRSCVTGVEAVRVDGATALVPKTSTVPEGETLCVRGRVSADLVTVSATVEFVGTRVTSVDAVPVTTSVAPVGGAGEAVPFTQYLEVPSLRTVRVGAAGVSVPSGGHAVVTGLAHGEERRTEGRVPLLGELPVVGPLFSWRSTEKVTVRTLLVVSPLVLAAD